MTKGKYKAMVEIRDVIHRLRCGQTNRCIAREIKTDCSIVRKIREIAIQNQWLNPDLPMPCDEVIARIWNPKIRNQKLHQLDPYYDDLKLWREQGYSSVVIHQLIKDKCSCDAQAVRRYLNKLFPKPVEPVMVRPTAPGQDMDIDGKSHIAYALGHEACRRGINVVFYCTHQLFEWIHSGRGDGTHKKRLSQIIKMPLLILDDFGLQALNEMQQEDLYQVIAERYEKSSTIITSNRDFDEWPNIFANPLIGTAALDRLVHKGIQVIIEGPSYRLAEFKKTCMKDKKM